MSVFRSVCMSAAVLLILPAAVVSLTIYVDGSNTSGPWDGTIEHPYRYIQDGVNAASNGDTVHVVNGIYYENVAIDRSICLLGENRDSTVIDGAGSGDIVLASADEVHVSGFTIQNSETEPPGGKGVHLSAAKYCTISGNRISNHYAGVYLLQSDHNEIDGNILTNSNIAIDLHDSSDSNSVAENYIMDNAWGIFSLWSSDNLLLDNTIMGNDQGILFWDGSHSTIMGNLIRANTGDGIHITLYLMGYSGNTISENNIESNGGNGVYLYYSWGTIVSWNTITDNEKSGVYHRLSGGSDNTIIKNHLAENDSFGIYLEESDAITIYHNNLAHNGQNAHGEGTNTWDNGYPSGGNYWHDYTAGDDFSGPGQNEPGSDGIGDVPYDIPGGIGQDKYPLMVEYGVVFIRGDADVDKQIQMNDAINILLYLYVPGSPALVCMDGGDADDDGQITMHDALYILNYLYVPGSPEPPAPFPGCGMDQTEDELVCLSYPPCE